MAIDPPHGGRLPTVSTKAPPSDAKPRGANRSSKVAGKLQVLPEQPDVPTQSTILPDPSKPKPPPKAGTTSTSEPTSASAVDSDEEDGDDEEEELEEEDAEVCRLLLHYMRKMLIILSRSDLYSNRSNSGGDCSTRCTTPHEEEGQIAAPCNRLCHSLVSFYSADYSTGLLSLFQVLPDV